jgi:hypothetical protein
MIVHTPDRHFPPPGPMILLAEASVKSPLRFLVIIFFLTFAPGISLRAADLASASGDELKASYAQLRQLHAGDQWANVDNVIWKRDAGTFTFQTGRLVFAAPVNGRIVAAAFDGQGTFRLNPPEVMDQRQISRFTKAPNLTDTFRKAVFFFTDNSSDQFKD